MDALLCDELLQEIFQRLSPSSSSSSAVSLVSKRWLHLYRTSKTSLFLHFTPHNSLIPSLSSLLSHYPFLSSLSLTFSVSATTTTTSTFSDEILVAVSSSCANLLHFRFLAAPVSHSSLRSLSKACRRLTSLHVVLSRTRPFFFNWVVSFSSLKELSVSVSGEFDVPFGEFDVGFENSDVELALESLYLSGIRSDDLGLGWLWRSCRKLTKLQLKSCEGIGDGGSFSSFTWCLRSLQEVELRICRTIVDEVLLKLSENCQNLNSLLVYDGGSKIGLLQFINNCTSKVKKLDLRLPLDLENDHLLAIARKFSWGLWSLRLESCCLVTGEGLKAIGTTMSIELEELALINCDVVEREPGLLTTLGQNLRRLRKLDLSHNEMMREKEFISMLVSCNCVIDLKLRGCKGLTNAAMASLLKSCKRLECLDIMDCYGIDSEAVELFVLNSPRLKLVQVEERKLSNKAKMWASHKFIEVVSG